MFARLLTVLLLVVSQSAAAAETVHLLTYHLHPPFITGPGAGLTHELAARLEEASGGALEVVVTPVPRARLNEQLADWIAGDCPLVGDCRDDWMVAWVNPSWGFGADAARRFEWTPLLEDRNVVISTTANPVRYESPESLAGLRLAGIRGHRYVGIDDLVAAGRIERVDGNHERSNLLMLLSGRVDALLLPESAARWFAREDGAIAAEAERLFVAPTPHQTYTRYLMVPPGREDLARVAAAVGNGRMQSKLAR